MKISLKEKLAQLAIISFVFTKISWTKTSNGQKLAILTLAEPMEHVRGSQSVDIDGTIVPVTASDVTEIKVIEDDIDDNFTWDEEAGVGEYAGEDLVLDVAKSDKSVWLKAQTFANSGREYINNQRADRMKGLFGAAVKAPAAPARKAGAELVDTNK